MLGKYTEFNPGDVWGRNTFNALKIETYAFEESSTAGCKITLSITVAL